MRRERFETKQQSDSNDVALRARALQERTERLQATVASLAKDLKFQSEESQKRREEQLEREKKLKEEERIREAQRRERRERHLLRTSSSPETISTGTRSPSYSSNREIYYRREYDISSPSRSYSTQSVYRNNNRNYNLNSYSSNNTSSYQQRGFSSNRHSSPNSRSSIYNNSNNDNYESRRTSTSTTNSNSNINNTNQDNTNNDVDQRGNAVDNEENNNLDIPVVQLAEGEEMRWRKPTLEESLSTPEQYCPILCRETTEWVVTSCGHYFDEEAITTWLSQPESVESCPICRKPFRLFDKKAQRDVAHNLVLLYLNYIGGQYKRLWSTDSQQIIDRFWESLPQVDLTNLCNDYNTKEGINISLALHTLLETSIQAYCLRLHTAVYDIVLRDVKLNLSHVVPPCFRTQLNKENTVYIAYSLTRLVPEFHIKWWKNTYLTLIQESMEELFISKLYASTATSDVVVPITENSTECKNNETIIGNDSDSNTNVEVNNNIQDSVIENNNDANNINSNTENNQTL